MSHKVESMAWANEVPWHGLGVQVADTLTPAQMLKASQCDWTVSKRRIYMDGKDQHGKAAKIEVPQEFALVRDSDQSVLSMVGSSYEPVQNETVFEFFKDFCKAGKLKIETAGSLWGGRYVWVLARVNADFQVGKSDEVRPYILMMSPHVFGKALLFQYTPIRVVCWNTLTYALGEKLRGDGSGFRILHSQDFKVKSEEAKLALKLALDQTTEFKAASILLAKKRATDEKVGEFFLRVLRPTATKTELADMKKTPVLVPKFQLALEKAPGAQLVTAKGTWWGALNAVSYIIDHEIGRDRQTGLKNAWLGYHANTKMRALKLAMEYAK